jgi:Protein of unknown function (DUF3443)/Bacterial Ig-like domain (group 2)
MRSNSLRTLFLLLLALAGCGGGSTGGTAAGTVSPATKALVSITVTPAKPVIAVGTTLQFSALGTYSDGTTQNLTPTVTWGATNTTVATISNVAGSNGKATPAAAGSTDIIATMQVTEPAPGSISGSTTLTVTGGGISKVNVLPVTVNGSLCSSGSYLNKPCVSVTVCTPGTSTCQVVSDLLLDTGSSGLRIFKQVLNVPLTQATVAGGALAECTQFGDGTSLWGPVQTAGVVLGSEPIVQVPLQVIDSTFATRPSGCLNALTTPASTGAGFNGILGVGLFRQDCGALCVSSVNNGFYSACNGSLCSGITVPLARQVQNPVALLPQDNNGVVVQLPVVPTGGVLSVDGTLVLGIGTQANNTPAAVTAFPTNAVGDFTTIFNGASFSNSFIDSGSNGLFFTAPATLLPLCPVPNTGFYCPAATISLSATNTGATGSPSGPVAFQIGNLSTLLSTSNNVFSEVGGSGIGQFDWGLPFFYGRNVFVGFEGRSSTLGTGPYWAY